MSYKSKVFLAVLFVTLAVLMLAYKSSLPQQEQVSQLSKNSTTSRHNDVQSSNRGDVQNSNRYTTSRQNDIQSSNTSTTLTSRHDTQSSTTSRPGK